MGMKLDATFETRLTILSTAPRNKWIALSADETRIVAVGGTFQAASEAAQRAGEDDPLLVRVPGREESLTVRVARQIVEFRKTLARAERNMRLFAAMVKRMK